MSFLLIQLFLFIFYQKVFASIYDASCNKTCNFSGMVCVNGRCKCSSKDHLFWTGARCLTCPPSWAISETACIRYYETKTSWMAALAVCQSMKGDLISFRDSSVLSLIYQVMNGKNGRRKRRQIVIDRPVAWTSAHAIDLTNLGLYQWNDDSLQKFDSRDSRWCKRTNVLGYDHGFTEPTRIVNENQAEKCVLFRRGIGSIQMVCLDDVFCQHTYPFICEISESTGKKFNGTAPTNMGSTGGKNNSNSNNEHHLGSLADADTKNKKSTIIIIALILLLLGAIIAGVFFFLKRRNGKEKEFDVGGNNIKGNQTSSNIRESVASGTNIGDTNDEDESSSHHGSAVEDRLTLGNAVGPENIDNQKQQNIRRGGYSKQNFDEFE